MSSLPPKAAWRHLGARDGFEVVFIRSEGDGYRLEGHSTAVEEGVAWGVRYAISVDASWATRSAYVAGMSAAGTSEVLLESDGAGSWLVDGAPAARLGGCFDVDLEASALTNAFPLQRTPLDVGSGTDAPAAYVRAPDLRVERLEQTYMRLPDEGARRRYDYAAPRFEYRDVLVYDEHGLVLDYPGIATRVA